MLSSRLWPKLCWPFHTTKFPASGRPNQPFLLQTQIDIEKLASRARTAFPLGILAFCILANVYLYTLARLPILPLFHVSTGKSERSGGTTLLIVFPPFIFVPMPKHPFCWQLLIGHISKISSFILVSDHDVCSFLHNMLTLLWLHSRLCGFQPTNQRI